MTKISKKEVLKIAYLSRIALKDDEIGVMSKQLQEVLTYAHRVCDIAADISFMPRKNVNIFREDVIVPDDPKAIMEQAPEAVQNYFVVPMILDAKE